MRWEVDLIAPKAKQVDLDEIKGLGMEVRRRMMRFGGGGLSLAA